MKTHLQEDGKIAVAIMSNNQIIEDIAQTTLETNLLLCTLRADQASSGKNQYLKEEDYDCHY